MNTFEIKIQPFWLLSVVSPGEERGMMCQVRTCSSNIEDALQGPSPFLCMKSINYWGDCC